MQTLIISACTDAGVNINGANIGAKKLGKYLESKNLPVIYLQNDPHFVKETSPTNYQKNINTINTFNKKLYDTITNEKKFSLTIGGDHSIAIGSALASNTNNQNIGIIWFDAHPDYNTFKTTITGNIHGLPLAAINGFETKELTTFTNNYIKPENTVIIGARSIDPKEKENLLKTGVKLYTTTDIHKYGLKYIITEAIKIASKNTNGIHISYDLDVIDPKIAPGVSIPEINGITKKEAIDALNLFLTNIDKIVSFDLVEFNPLKDNNHVTYDLATNILDNIINTLK